MWPRRGHVQIWSHKLIDLEQYNPELLVFKSRKYLSFSINLVFPCAIELTIAI